MCAQLSPYFVIRTEREAIHAVALGSDWTRLLERPRDTDDDIEASFQAKNSPSNPNNLYQSIHYSRTTTSNSKYASNDSSNGHWLLGKEQSFVKAPEGSDGIFDDDTDDDDDRKHSLKDDPANADGSLSFGMLESEDQNLRLPEVVTPNTVDTRIAYVGGSRGSIGVYDSETGRVLDRVEGAHGDNSVLLVEELLSDDQGNIIFASQARDGYIRFWTVYAESGVSEPSAFPLLASKRMRICLRPFSSPVFVGGEAFCKASFLKNEGLAASCSERGSIAVWNYQDVLCHIPSKASPNSTLFSPKCVVSYEGDKYGMCMSLQLINSTERTPTLLFAGFEDGSILAWSLSEVDSISPDGQHQVVLFYSLLDSFRPFATTPVLSFSMLNFASLLERQEPSPQDLSSVNSSSSSSSNNSSYMECSDKGLAWVGVCTSSEETIVTFLFGFCGASSDLSSSKGHFSTMDSYITPHGGYQDVQIREDSLVAVAGWDHRIRLFLLEASIGATPTQFRLQLRSLAILRYHAASVQSVALGDPSSRLLASASTDQKVALWKVF